MSFSAYARKVRDPTLPYRRRVSALRSCVQLYRPIGFHATLSFLEELAGPYERDEAALLRALDALAASRALRNAEAQRYAQARRAAKRLGHRSPRRGDPHPAERFGYWYGAPRQAALHALRYWRRKPSAPAPVDRHPAGTRRTTATIRRRTGLLEGHSPRAQPATTHPVRRDRRRAHTVRWYEDSRLSSTSSDTGMASLTVECRVVLAIRTGPSSCTSETRKAGTPSSPE